MDTNMDIADELLVLVNRGDIGDYNRVAQIMDILYNRKKLKGNDFPALEAGQEYVRKMQALLDQQEQRQNQ